MSNATKTTLAGIDITPIIERCYAEQRKHERLVTQYRFILTFFIILMAWLLLLTAFHLAYKAYFDFAVTAALFTSSVVSFWFLWCSFTRSLARRERLFTEFIKASGLDPAAFVFQKRKKHANDTCTSVKSQSMDQSP